MFAATKGIYIVGAKRTAFGVYGGSLKGLSLTQLQTAAAKAALTSAGVHADQVDTVVIGNTMACSSSDGIYMPRHVSLSCGVPIEKPALGVNRLCGSGFQSIVNAVQDILLGGAKVALAGGVESMSQAPHIVRNIRFGTALGKNCMLEDSLWDCRFDSYGKVEMAITAENLAEQNKISRERCDEFALRSHQKWAEAQKNGIFNAEIAPIKIKVKGKEIDFAIDEHPRPQTTLANLAKLSSIFKKNGTVTAGTASGVADGAGAVVLASEDAVNEYKLKPLARLVAFSSVGVDPEIMGIGPVQAIMNVLQAAGKKLTDIDLIEINEAFAAQTLACADVLCVDPDKLNMNGGAIALGHPLGASGARISAHLVHEMHRRKVNYSIGSACIGGGQGIALLFEKC